MKHVQVRMTAGQLQLSDAFTLSMRGIMNKDALRNSCSSDRTLLTSHTYFALLNAPIMQHSSTVSRSVLFELLNSYCPALLESYVAIEQQSINSPIASFLAGVGD